MSKLKTKISNNIKLYEKRAKYKRNLAQIYVIYNKIDINLSEIIDKNDKVFNIWKFKSNPNVFQIAINCKTNELFIYKELIHFQN